MNAYKPDVAEMLAHDFATAAENTHSLYLEERRLAVQTAAAGKAVDTALQDFYRDRMAYVIDAGTTSLRMDWRRDRQAAEARGENLRHVARAARVAGITRGGSRRRRGASRRASRTLGRRHGGTGRTVGDPAAAGPMRHALCRRHKRHAYTRLRSAAGIGIRA
jgi:hypothetical protein